MSEQERLERAALQLAWEILAPHNRPEELAPSGYWARMTDRRRDRFRRLAAAALVAADEESVKAP
jgi:hypothetical protein